VTLCCGGIANNTNVNITAQASALQGLLRHTAEQHEQDALLDLLVSVDHGKQALAQIGGQVLVVAHLVDLHPLLIGHGLLELLHVQVLDVVVFAAELKIRNEINKIY
jgi:hypothetical protein